MFRNLTTIYKKKHKLNSNNIIEIEQYKLSILIPRIDIITDL